MPALTADDRQLEIVSCGVHPVKIQQLSDSHARLEMPAAAFRSGVLLVVVQGLAGSHGCERR